MELYKRLQANSFGKGGRKLKAGVVEKVIKGIKKTCKVKKGSGGKLRNYDKKGRYAK